MKRFITYLYEYENGQKGKNTGFVRVDERNGVVTMQVSVRNLIRSHEKGRVYAFVSASGLKELELGELGVINGQADERYQFACQDVMQSGYGLEDIVGIGIRFPTNVYLASCWKDEAADEIGRGAYDRVLHEDKVEHITDDEVLPEEKMTRELELVQEDSMSDGKVLQELEVAETVQEMQLPEKIDLVTYQKLELNQIRTLPSKNWYLCNNRFLVHGFWNYKYLVLKKVSSSNEEMAYLGVPGVFEKPEMVMATLFGFPEFEALPMEVSSAQMNQEVTVEELSRNDKKSQEPKSGTFGCWLIPLHV